MIRSLFVAILASCACMVAFSSVHADNCTYDGTSDIKSAFTNCKPTGMIETAGGYGVQEVKQKVISIANRIITATAVIAMLGIVISGFMYVQSMGDDEKAKNAKKALTSSIVGFAIALMSFPLVNAIINFIYQSGR